jgi:hypothetical protein
MTGGPGVRTIETKKRMDAAKVPDGCLFALAPPVS